MRTALAFAAYAIAFIVLHQIAVLWGRGTTFSFWFPGAGLRFAVLWRYGPRRTLPVAAAELIAFVLLGQLKPGPHFPFDLIAMSLPPLIYGAVIALCRRYLRASEPIFSVGSFTLIFASIAAPMVTALAEVPLAYLRQLQPIITTLPDAVRTAAVFAVGDMTAVLLLSPPLIWFFEGRVPSIRRLAAPRWILIESFAILSGAWLLTALAAYGGLGRRLLPVLLGVSWVGLRAGRTAAWLAVALTAAIALPLSAEDVSQPERFAVQLALATTAIIGTLLGSFSDAEFELREQVEKRNRLLFHADRLRTLRAMSWAIIHEIGQPLSVISIEARHLSSLAAQDRDKPGELIRSASLVEQKVVDLAELVKRLRRFGETSHREPARVNVGELVRESVAIAQLEANPKDVAFDVSVPDGLQIQGETVELEQALLNLLRNAVQRTADGQVRLKAGRLETGHVHIDVENRSGPESLYVEGMGIGLLVATSIVEAFGGALEKERTDDSFRVRMMFPAIYHD